MAKARYKEFLEKSVQSAISAIEIYNKPDFKYREESFSILMINSWELLFKAKILKDNNGSLNSIYVADRKTTKDGKPIKRFYPKRNRAGNPLTLGIFESLGKCSIDTVLKENIDLLTEIRDNSIHFINNTKEFEKIVLEIGTATLRSYLDLVNIWFNYNLDKYNFYLMPISFFHTFEMESFSINGKTEQQENFFAYVSKKMIDNPTDLANPHNVALKLETKFERSSTSEALPVKYANDSPIIVRQAIENKIKIGLENGTLYDHNDFIEKLKKAIPNFKLNSEFYDHRRKLEGNDKYQIVRYLDPIKKTGSKKSYWTLDAFNEIKSRYQS